MEGSGLLLGDSCLHVLFLLSLFPRWHCASQGAYGPLRWECAARNTWGLSFLPALHLSEKHCDLLRRQDVMSGRCVFLVVFCHLCFALLCDFFSLQCYGFLSYLVFSMLFCFFFNKFVSVFPCLSFLLLFDLLFFLCFYLFFF